MNDLTEIKYFLEHMNISNQKQFIRLVVQHQIPYTENKNGTFINISNLNDPQLCIIEKFISLISDEETIFNKIEQTKIDLKKLICTNSESSSKCI